MLFPLPLDVVVDHGGYPLYVVGVAIALLVVPLYFVLLGFLGLWWDLRRRELRLRENLPDPEAVETFSIQRLAELGAAVSELQLTANGVLDTVHSELEDARAERRKAVAAKAGSAPKTPQAGAAGNVIPFDQMSRDAQLAAVEARYK